jgi:hypothetical protein
MQMREQKFEGTSSFELKQSNDVQLIGVWWFYSFIQELFVGLITQGLSKKNSIELIIMNR